MTQSTNDITGDILATKPTTDAYKSGWDRIFGKKKCPEAFKMGEHACADRSQCFEPCGDLGRSAEHAKSA